MSLRSAKITGDRRAQRLERCPYCGHEFSNPPGQEIAAHLPCDHTPSTDEVAEALR